MKKKSDHCIICGTELSGRQKKFCSNPCKQKWKYAVDQGRMCAFCGKPKRKVPVLGGYEKYHKACKP